MRALCDLWTVVCAADGGLCRGGCAHCALRGHWGIWCRIVAGEAAPESRVPSCALWLLYVCAVGALVGASDVLCIDVAVGVVRRCDEFG